MCVLSRDSLSRLPLLTARSRHRHKHNLQAFRTVISLCEALLQRLRLQTEGNILLYFFFVSFLLQRDVLFFFFVKTTSILNSACAHNLSGWRGKSVAQLQNKYDSTITATIAVCFFSQADAADRILVTMYLTMHSPCTVTDLILIDQSNQLQLKLYIRASLRPMRCQSTTRPLHQPNTNTRCFSGPYYL